MVTPRDYDVQTMPFYSIHSDMFTSKLYKQFKKYVLRQLDLSSKESLRLFHSWALDMAESYIKVIKPAFPSWYCGRQNHLKPAEGKLYFSSEVQGWQFFQVISFDTWRNFLQMGNNFHKKFDITEVKEIDIRKCLLWVLYSPRIRKPYNAKLSPCPGVLITCSCRRNIWFLKTLQSWLSGEREKITLHCLIFPDVAGIQVRIEWLTLSWLWQERMH